ncbi:hypothetical protein MS2017_1626 [Bathymodiolus thermophilus thioautotrophic gill symbiont]|uniref:ABC-three component systems C-terminal domain-containing protein n=1 Tax=Bathymodiolus thermophilus thioautotrophic gill symbiont TaxID=2360 RepID=A0A3G3INN9_9GAMM|nr:ABC-three component system protein [Bathymodiolus thermophilus thioautotrophic gill symbiont]AYQ57309.1 hypothetical protein MS2017_1626 [Bathymodiolus thermophilus thioautotrophic gill symbiont]
MNSQEKALARRMFKLKIHESNGQEFEDLFTSIMNYAEQGFQAIRPWGNIGDRKNDGYIESAGIFFQVYAPEEITGSYVKVVDKTKKDFEGLKKQWASINEFYFVVNDKYKGVNADCEQAIQAIKREHGLNNAGFKTAKDLEDLLFSLDDDQIFSVIGFLPDPEKITLDFTVLSEIISYLMKLPLSKEEDSSAIYPDWNDKIQFNDLGGLTSQYLNTASFQVASLDSYLKNESNFFAEEIKDKIRNVYKNLKNNYSGDDLFLEIVTEISPKQCSYVQASVIILLAKYFETCDIFKEPK